jgi:hypothetical protein
LARKISLVARHKIFSIDPVESVESGGNRWLVSVIRTGGDWDVPAVKTLVQLGFCQELEVEGQPIPTPKHVFVKYDYGDNPAAIRDSVLNRIEPFNKKNPNIKTYVVVTEDLVPLIESYGAETKK